jgi:hypothetical protein
MLLIMQVAPWKTLLKIHMPWVVFNFGNALFIQHLIFLLEMKRDFTRIYVRVK